MEKVPKKKARKGIKKGAALGLLLAAVLGCCAGIFWLNRPIDPVDLPQVTPATILLSRDGGEITALAIAPRDGKAYPMTQGADGNFYLLGKTDIPLRSDVISEMLYALTDLEAAHTVMDTQDADLSHFGLNPAQVEITITYSDGEKKKLLIGDQAPAEEEEYYCMLEGDSNLYTLLAPFCDPFFHDVEYMRAFEQPQLDASLLDRIDISGNLTLGLQYTPAGWYLDAPVNYPVSTLQSEALLARIEAMAFEACLGSSQEVDLKELGLMQPALKIIFTQAPTRISGVTVTGETVSWEEAEKRYTLLIGHETGKSGVYLMWEGMVYKASNFLLGFWKELTMEQLLLRTPVNFLTHQLSSVSFRYRNHQAQYQVFLVESITENNEIATDEYGQILYDVAVKKAGEADYMDAEAFLNWYTLLAGLSPAGMLPAEWEKPIGIQAEGEIILKNDHLTRAISFYPYDALHYAMEIDGTAVYYMEKSWLETVLPLP